MMHKTTRSILSVLLAVLLLVTSTPLTPAFAGEEGAASLQSESGESEGLKQVDGVYQIGSAAELRKFAELVNGGKTDANTRAELTDDINLNNQPWTPIGTSRPYRGTFDGNGKTISGLYINSSSANDQGLFGYVSGTVQNLSVSGSVSGPDSGTGNRVGGVVGYNSGTVKNCYNTGSVTGNRNVGGVVGENGGTVENCYNTGSVTNSYNTGAVSGGEDIGGVVGYNFGNVTNSYNTGEVSGNISGGVVGQNHGSVTNCYNIGTVSGGEDVGGVVGYNISSVTNCYFLQGTAGKGIGVGGDEDAEDAESLTADQFKNQNSFTDWDFGSTDIPGIWEINTTLNRPVLTSNHEDDGSKDHPYEIFTATQLENFRDLVNGEGAQTADTDAHAKLMNNIDLKDVCGLALDDGQPVSWTPIGNDAHQYIGTFDGNGKTISGLYINNSTADYQGLFGYVGSSGKVQDLSVSGSVSGPDSGTGNRVGGVVGYNNGGTVTGCIFSGSGSVSGGWYVGGVVGENRGTVENCHNAGKVSGSNTVGGVVGDNSGIVTNCYNTDSVSGPDSGNSNQVGGVVGQNHGSVTNCYNTGTVSDGGNSSAVGGVVGCNQGGSVQNCYNTGEVSGNSSFVGGVVGWNIGNVTNCYNTDSITVTGSGGRVGGVVGDNYSSVTNCYNTGKVSDPDSGNSNSVGGVVGSNSFSATVTNCYFLQDTAESGIGKNEGSDTATATEKDDTAFHSGEVAWRLQDGQTAGEGGVVPLVWGQSDLNTPDSWPTLVALDKNAKPVYKVAFISDNTEIEAQYANNGMTVGSPTTNPTKEGYTFAGWKDENESVPSFPITVSGNLTYYAKWTPVAEPDPTPTPTPTPDPTPSGPSTGDSTGWDDILDELENTAKGDQITIDMGDETKVPAEIFESLAGKDVDVTFDLGDIQWSASGADIPTDTDFTDLDLGASLGTHGIPVNVINTITGEVGTVQITLAHDGEFGFTMTLTAPLGKENAGYWANLYHYDEDAEALNFEAAAKIDEDGSVTIPFSHASQYAIVIDTHSHAAVDVSDIFSDIARDAWYKDAVQYAYDQGLMTGVSDTEFAPEQTTTRAMIVSILARLENVTTAEAAGFADVDDEWYATAVNWAANVGVVNGYEDNTFRPNQPITREQLAAILMNYANYKGQDVSARASLDNYTDQPSTWAQEAMQWAVAEGLISGVTADTLQPQGAATRAQVAAILQRFLSE